MVNLDFGAEQTMRIEVGPPNSLHQGAGIHRLSFPARFETGPAVRTGLPIAVSCEVWLGSNRSDWLGVATPEQPFVTRHEQEDTGALILPLTDQQLAVIEQRRAGQDLQFGLDVDVVLSPDGTRSDQGDIWPFKRYQTFVGLQSGPWLRLLSQASAGTTLAVVVPVPIGRAGKLPAAGRRLHEALNLLNDGHYESAIGKARKAIEEFGHNPGSLRRVADMKADERTLSDRLALLDDALYSLASAATHSDPATANVVWTRELALAVIAGVAAWLAAQPPVPTAN